MTEERIERTAERMMDLLDRYLLAGIMTQAEYDEAVTALNQWCDQQHERRRA